MFSNYVIWIPAEIVKKISSIRYLIQVNGNRKVAHINQFKKVNIRYMQSRPLTYCIESRKRLRSNEEHGMLTRSKTRKMFEDDYHTMDYE